MLDFTSVRQKTQNMAELSAELSVMELRELTNQI